MLKNQIHVTTAIRDRINNGASDAIWTPSDFVDLANIRTVNVSLSRMQDTEGLQRISRGLYFLPRYNKLKKGNTVPRVDKVVEAVARREGIPYLIDGMTAANQLMLEDGVPTRTTVYIPSRLRPITIGRRTIEFQTTSAGRMTWAGRPAMPLVQAMHYLRDKLDTEEGRSRLHKMLDIRVFSNPEIGSAIVADLVEGFHLLPEWMRVELRPHLSNALSKDIDEENDAPGMKP